MYLLLCTALLGSALAVPLTEEIATRNDEVHYLLPGESLPTFYDVQLFFDPNNADNFTGTVEIRVLPVIQTNVFVLHAMEMDIDSIEVYFEGDTSSNLFESYDHASDDTHFLRINLNTIAASLTPHIIRISYTGRFAENMFGVYVSTYVESGETVNLITSQLQPTFARRAFPCYDQPGLKAVFRTTIYSPAAFDVIRSNTPERSEDNNLKEDVAGWVKHEFEDTLVMSTYLIAYLVSNFDHVSNEDDKIFHLPFNVFSRPGTREQAQFALQYGQENMNALEAYTDFPYAFAKIDKAAVPDFAAGAMENWGLVIYREVALLVVDGVTTTATLQTVARLICHENVHMWFGNEVSPTTWTYTWLNEGFASLFEMYGTDLVRPTFRMMDQFVVALQNVMQSDAVVSVNPMTHQVYTPSQIIGTFNAVAYQKSGSVIRMMQHALTPEVFRSGLIQYLRVNSRRAATPNELYNALQNALNESGATFPATINAILTHWTTQGGFPVLTVRRSAPTAQSVSVAQERFLTDPAQRTDDRWHVPLNWVLSTEPNFNDTSPQAWLGVGGTAQAFQINGLQDAEWFVFNKQQTGYYRVNYEPANWQALAKVLNEDHDLIHLLNRAQIVDDSFNLARNGRLNYIHALEISRYLLEEKDYIPWASANNVFNYLDIVLSGTPIYDLYQYYLLQLTEPLYGELGFQVTDNDEFVTAYHRNIILDINCRYGNEHCVNEAERLLQQFRDNPSTPLNPDIQTTVFCSGLRSGSVENFNYLWQQYEHSTDASQQTILLNSLGCTTNADRLDFYLGQVIDDDSPVREQDKHTVIVSVINSSPENMEVALDFVVEHFDQIQPRVQGLTGTTNILNAFARRLNSVEHRDKIADFNSRHSNIMTPAETASVAAIEENISASITWSTTNLGVIESWLQEQFPSSAGAVTSSIVVLISVVAVMLSS